jgi:ABC-type enterochelin transport system permease subunit
MSYQPAYQPVSRTSSLAIVSLIFGVLSWCLLPFIGAIVAIVCGHLARGEIRRAAVGTLIEGDGMAIAGMVLGYVHLACWALVLLVVLGVLFLGAGLHWH